MSFLSFPVIRAIRESSLPATQRHVLIAIAFRADQGGECWASQATLADDTGLTERTVRRSLTALVEAGCLVPRVRPGATTLYRVETSGIPPRTPDTGSGVPRTQDPPTPDTGSAVTGSAPDTGSGVPRTQDPPTPDTVSDDPTSDPTSGSNPTPLPPAQRAGGSGSALLESCRRWLEAGGPRLHRGRLTPLAETPEQRAALVRLALARDQQTARDAIRGLRELRELPAGIRRVGDLVGVLARAAALVEQPETHRPAQDARAPEAAPEARARWRDLVELDGTVEAQALAASCVPVALAGDRVRLWCDPDERDIVATLLPTLLLGRHAELLPAEAAA